MQEHCPPENHSPFATRYSLPFWLGSSLAFPIHSAPVPRSSSRSKSALSFCVTDYGLKSVLRAGVKVR
ncbi:MAG: hypothetical protein RRA51_01465 [Armatimonadota bacterium]|nr:hypothetical protein [Armatimonadota bacterium]